MILFRSGALDSCGFRQTAASLLAVTTIDRQAGESHLYPQFLPRGQRFLYLVRHSDPEKGGIYIGALDGKAPPVRVLKTDLQARYDAPTGRLLYVENGGVVARRLELDPPRLVGDPTRLAENIAVAQNFGYADFSVSGTSTLFYARAVGAGRGQFGGWDRAGCGCRWSSESATLVLRLR